MIFCRPIVDEVDVAVAEGATIDLLAPPRIAGKGDDAIEVEDIAALDEIVEVDLEASFG